MKNDSDKIAFKKMIKNLGKEYGVLGERRVDAWEAWLVIVLAIGIFFGIVLFAHNSGDFVLDCEYSSGLCGGLWTHSYMHGQLGSVFAAIPGELFMAASLPPQIANVIGAAPGFSIFMLGFISAALIFGLIWDKFDFLPKAGKTKARRRRSFARSGGFISSEYVVMFFLAVLMTIIISSPVSYGTSNNTALVGKDAVKQIKEKAVRQIKPIAPINTQKVEPASRRFSVGDEVVVRARVFNVRETPDGEILKERNYGAKGTIVEGPNMRGRIWWKIEFENGESGWVAESFIHRADKFDNEKLFPVATSSPIKLKSNSSIGEFPSGGVGKRWVADAPGIARIKIDNISRLDSIRKNGIEIWERSTSSRPNLKMEFLVVPTDTVDFVVTEGENIETNIEVAPLAPN